MPPISEAVQVALATGLLALIGIMTKSMIDGHVVRKQVQNSHQTNLRDDLDRVHSLVTKVSTQVETLDNQVTTITHDLGGIRSEMRGVHTEIADIHAHDREADREHRTLSERIADLADRVRHRD